MSKFQEIKDKIDALEAEHAVENQAKYDEGYAAGVKSVAEGEKIYSQAELDAKVLPLEEKVALLQAQVDAFSVAIETAKIEAIESFKAELRAHYEAEQSTESDAEKKFGDLLAAKLAPAPEAPAEEPAPAPEVEEIKVEGNG